MRRNREEADDHASFHQGLHYSLRKESSEK